MSEQLLKEASEMFNNEEQWKAACELANLIPQIKTYWFKEFIEKFSEEITPKIQADERLQDFQIKPYGENDNSASYWYILPSGFGHETDEYGNFFGLSVVIEVDNSDPHCQVGLSYYGRKKPTKKFFNENLKEFTSYFKENKNNEVGWVDDGCLCWNDLYPEDLKADWSDPETIYYLHEHPDLFVDYVVETTLAFIEENTKMLISANKELKNKS